MNCGVYFHAEVFIVCELVWRDMERHGHGASKHGRWLNWLRTILSQAKVYNMLKATYLQGLTLHIKIK